MHIVSGRFFLFLNPINKAPPRRLVQETIGLFVVLKPAKNAADAGKCGTHRLRVGSIHPPVVQHPDPEKRKRRDGLRQGTWIAAARESFWDSGVIEGVESLMREMIVAGNGVGDEGLDARITDVLKLFVVGRVHVGFVSIEARGAPTDLPYFVEFGIAGLKGGAFFEGIGGELRIE